MHKKTILITSLLIIFIISCTGTSTKKTQDIDVRVGFDGLKMEFLKNTPPQRIFEGDKFPVVVKVRNSGAADIKSNAAFISIGFEKDYTKNIELLTSGNVQPLSGLNNIASFGIEGKSIINQKGGEEVISYNLVAGKVDPQSEFHSSAAIATLCYPYKTVLDATFCMDTDPNNLRPGKKVCKLQDLAFANGQGAPVAISKIEVQMLPSQDSGKITPQFLIYVENKGTGIVIKNDAVKEFCTQGKVSSDKFNTITVKAFFPGTGLGEELDCEPKEKGNKEKQGYVKLKDKKDIIRCAFKEGIQNNQDPFLKPLRIDMTYGYTQSISASYLTQKTAR
ncbi:hypothetical protein J4234_05105 [Candidatus Woesearchaeota archaeon]|nr:hypothetical protein [Candidatus Woesearchaeota archaeon]